MKAMILAAGLGKRMRPLTDHTPKPLLPVAGKSLIVYHIEALVASGISDLVINLAYLGEKIETYLGSGSAWGANIEYSQEETLLETGGGIAKALPLLGADPFVLVNGDVWTDFDFSALADSGLFSRLQSGRATSSEADLAHLVMVPNPEQHPEGDFYLAPARPPEGQKQLVHENKPEYLHEDCEAKKLTYAGIGLLSPDLFNQCPSGAFALPKLLIKAMARRQVTGQQYAGRWIDVGTPERLQKLESQLLTGC
jgi:N-acetyl-alpha-D-muramate 1-phosphate uridylyltransferase